jgi:hypothetical protein
MDRISAVSLLVAELTHLGYVSQDRKAVLWLGLGKAIGAGQEHDTCSEYRVH